VPFSDDQTLVDQVADDLLQEERVAFGAFEDRLCTGGRDRQQQSRAVDSNA
jgi:hypothetical protein